MTNAVLDPHTDRHKINMAHLDNPMPGDYWHEMFSPVALVITVVEGFVIFKKLCGGGLKELPDGKLSAEGIEPIAWTLKEFRKYMTYSSMSDKTWADVMPQRFGDTP